MPRRNKPIATAVIAGCLIAATTSAATSDRWNLPIATKKLDNGLTVVVSEDHSSPTVGISVVYRVGIRTEPRDRTGFAHLFEHLMFEGTPNAPHGVFDRVTTDGGGDNNGSTHPDFTSYIERAPVSALEPLLWLEADRMKTLAFSKKSLDGQRDVVKEEINVNVRNQPYGGFAETDLPMLAFQKWENGHDGYGSFDDLDKASLDDVRGFHRDFYGPNNAVLGIAGDVTPEQGFALAQKYFGAIAARPTPPRPDVDEPLNTAEKRIVQGDALAKLPALAIGWKMPPRGSHDQAAMVVLAELLAGGDASRLHQALVKGSAVAVQVDGFSGSGSPWEYDGPALFTLAIVYRNNATADLLLATIDGQLARILKEGVDPATLEGLKTRMLADWYDDLEPFGDRAETLAVLQAVWGDAKIAHRVPELIDGVTSADIQRVAATYLTHANRSVIDRRPDFLLADDDPARSDLRAKAKPKPKPVTGKVTLGEMHSEKTAPAPAAVPPATVPPPPATAPSKLPLAAPVQGPAATTPDAKKEPALPGVAKPGVAPASPSAREAGAAAVPSPSQKPVPAGGTSSAAAPPTATPPGVPPRVSDPSKATTQAPVLQPASAAAVPASEAPASKPAASAKPGLGEKAEVSTRSGGVPQGGPPSTAAAPSVPAPMPPPAQPTAVPAKEPGSAAQPVGAATAISPSGTFAAPASSAGKPAATAETQGAGAAASAGTKATKEPPTPAKQPDTAPKAAPAPASGKASDKEKPQPAASKPASGRSGKAMDGVSQPSAAGKPSASQKPASGKSTDAATQQPAATQRPASEKPASGKSGEAKNAAGQVPAASRSTTSGKPAVGASSKGSDEKGSSTPRPPAKKPASGKTEGGGKPASSGKAEASDQTDAGAGNASSGQSDARGKTDTKNKSDTNGKTGGSGSPASSKAASDGGNRTP